MYRYQCTFLLILRVFAWQALAKRCSANEYFRKEPMFGGILLQVHEKANNTNDVCLCFSNLSWSKSPCDCLPAPRATVTNLMSQRRPRLLPRANKRVSVFARGNRRNKFWPHPQFRRSKRACVTESSGRALDARIRPDCALNAPQRPGRQRTSGND